jgi:hypothetical protein
MYIFKLNQTNISLQNEPPLVPYKYPIIGHTFEYYKDVPGFLKKCHEEVHIKKKKNLLLLLLLYKLN